MLPFDVAVEELSVGGWRFRLWRPAHPPEVQDPEAERGAAGPVWAQTWTSGVVLAEVVARCSLKDVRVLELGCGLGLVGLAAARVGGRVTVNDRSKLALAFSAANAEDNRLVVETVQCEWQNPRMLEAHGQWDLVLGSDILYDERSAHAILGLLDRVVAPHGEVWIADPGRDTARVFLAAASSSWQLSSRACGYGVRLHRLRARVGTVGTLTKTLTAHRPPPTAR